MISMLSKWQGVIDINDQPFDSFEALEANFKAVSGPIHIKLYPKGLKRQDEAPARSERVNSSQISEHAEYKITVKKYMTEKSGPGFDFMAKMNHDNPMPLRTMTGWVEKETKGMVYMHLHGVGEPEVHCMRCQRHLTNPISKKYGIGPECMSKIGFAGIAIDDVDTIKNKLQEVTWSGWIIKSAITDEEEIV